MALEFLSPAWLFSLLAIPIVWWGVRRRRDLLHRVLRTAALIALTCALAQPVWWDAKGAPHHVLVLDESASAAGSKSESVHGALSAWLRGLEGDARTSLVRFGESPTDTIVEGVEAFDDETFVARPGDVVIVPAGRRATYAAPDHARMLFVYGPSDDGHAAFDTELVDLE